MLLYTSSEAYGIYVKYNHDIGIVIIMYTHAFLIDWTTLITIYLMQH